MRLALCPQFGSSKTRDPVSYRIVAQVRDVIWGVPETGQHQSIDQYIRVVVVGTAYNGWHTSI